MSAPKSKTRKPKDVSPAVSAFGSRGDNVSELQAFLRDHGYKVDDDPGYYGNYTRNAVAMFQEANGMLLNGHWDEATVTATSDLLAQGGVVPFPE
jgi:peptidoglycan hydrolase-like protein with peptidoglycan-binding domain